MSSVTDLVRQVKLLLEASPEAPSIPQVIDAIQCAVADWPSSSSKFEILLSSIEDIYHDVIDHDLFDQVDTLLTILYHLRPVIPAVSIITTWFDLLLRPALREPKLPASSVTYAKELILTALEKPEDDNADKLQNFKRRLLDLYLLDAFNEASGEDILEWAELDQDQRDRKAHWKSNLQDVVMTFGLKYPQDLMSEIFHCFAAPSTRLQLLILLQSFSSDPSFPSISPILATHPLLNSLILSLEVDNSSTACAVGVTLLSKILPIFAVYAPDALKTNLPQFFAILARMVCWEARSSFAIEGVEGVDPAVEENPASPEICPHHGWQRLEFSFKTTASTPPPVDLYFTYLYYLFPHNVIEFIRRPVQYLEQTGAECPYVLGWAHFLHEDKTRRRCEQLCQRHVMHASFLKAQDASAELREPIWRDFDISRIVGECTMMDVRNAVVEFGPYPQTTVLNSPDHLSKSLSRSFASDSSSKAGETAHQPGRFRVSVQNMIATSVALKSGMDVDIEDDELTSAWPNLLFSSSIASSPTRRSLSLPPDGTSARFHSNRELPSHVDEIVSRLQRRSLLFKNELNLELWIGRKNVQNTARLTQERVQAQISEVERQGLHNKLREYKADVLKLQKELKTHKEQASTAKNNSKNWNAELQQKLREFREQKRTWKLELSELRAANTQQKANFEAQGKLLASARNRVFELETMIKENAHKVDRLHDYEKQIGQLTTMLRLWEDDTRKLNEQGEQTRMMESDYQGMKLLLKSYQEGRVELETEVRVGRERIRTLETHLSIANQKLAEASDSKTFALATASEAAASGLAKTNERLREEKQELMEEIEELREMVEILKTREKPGLIGESPASTSPRISMFNMGR